MSTYLLTLLVSDYTFVESEVLFGDKKVKVGFLLNYLQILFRRSGVILTGTECVSDDE